uniref:Uncharacterized protein n=1 Tax=Rhizophora mucronata TaxID=61149 RepID=A0A2P2P9V0_RHIMU
MCRLTSNFNQLCQDKSLFATHIMQNIDTIIDKNKPHSTISI